MSNHSAVLYQYGDFPKWQQNLLSEPTENEVLIEVEASTINPSDVMFIEGNYFKRDLPTASGFEGVGKVLKAGKNKEDLIGKRVCFCTFNGGSWSNFVLVSHYVFPIDADVSVNSAASGIVNPLTALGFIHKTKSTGHNGFIHTAAASALGRMVNKLCIKQKINLINIVRRQQQADLLKSEGAEHVIVTIGNWQQQLKQLIQKLNIKVFFDALGGGDVQGEILKLLASGATAYIYGALQLKPTKVNCANFIFGLVVTGFLVGNWYASISTEDKNQIASKYSDYLKNELATTTSKQYKLDQIVQAIKYYKQNMTQGKVLLKP